MALWSTMSLKRTLFLVAAALAAAVVVVDATQVMHRPSAYRDSPHDSKIETKPETKIVHKRATSTKAQVAYFTNWGIYGANFQPTDIVPDPLTHILYSFADISPDTGHISLTDSYADEQKHFPGDSWDEPGNNLYGCLKQLYLLKLSHRNIKVLLSIGGWTYSQSGHFNFVTDSTKRATFVTDAVGLIENYGFDGIDLDFEYPNSDALSSGFASLLGELRTAFNNLQAQKGDSTPYELTAAVPAGSDNYSWLKVPAMDAALTFWNLMAYDYAGSWLTWADNQANLYGGARTNVSTDKAIKFYLANGATASKINMGIPLYGRAFEATTGIGAPYNGIGPGTIEAGVYSYKFLPMSGATVVENLTDVSSYSYDSSSKELVSYDTPHIATIKAQYVQTNGLAGSMFWELSQDKVGSDSLVGTTASLYGSLDQTQNHINYPSSKWDNIRSNMGQGSGSTPTSTRSSSTSTRSSTTSTRSSSTSTGSSSTSTRSSSTSTRSTSTSTKTTTTSTSSRTTTKSSSSVSSTTSGGSSTSAGSSSTSASSTSSTSTNPPASTCLCSGPSSTTSTTATPTSGSGACSTVSAWSATATYVGGQQASYNGDLWTAKWWTNGDIPGGAAGVWTDNGAC